MAMEPIRGDAARERTERTLAIERHGAMIGHRSGGRRCIGVSRKKGRTALTFREQLVVDGLRHYTAMACPLRPMPHDR
jgi:hypothetical protein